MKNETILKLMDLVKRRVAEKANERDLVTDMLGLIADDKSEEKGDVTAGLVAKLESVFARVMPQQPIVFVISRADFVAHLERRAAHHAKKVQDIEGDPKYGVESIYESRIPSHVPMTEVQRAAFIAEQRKVDRMMAVQQEKALAARFGFYATHLSTAAETFTLGFGELETYELVPSEHFFGGPMIGRGIQAVPPLY